MEYFLNAERLRLHAGELREQKYDAQRLGWKLEKASLLAGSTYDDAFRDLIKQAGELERFFHKLAELMDYASDEGDATSLQISRLLDDTRMDAGRILPLTQSWLL